jgi:hypothetical protein
MSESPLSGDPGGGPRALPQVRLVRRDEDVQVLPAPRDDAGPEQEFPPLKLAKLPRSVTDRLALFVELVHRRHNCCVGALLLLDRRSGDWNFRIPAQRCGRTASCWSALARDVPQVSEYDLLAGSFQSRLLASGEDAADAPPPHDGVHFVLRLEEGGGSILCFIRAQGKTIFVPADQVIYDDLEAALEECLPRLKLP